MERAAEKYGARLHWIDSSQDITEHLNSNGKKTVAQIDFFGHSNQTRWLLNYGESEKRPDTASDHWGINQFTSLKADILSPDMRLFSWGCKQANRDKYGNKGFCEASTERFNRSSYGSIGDTHYRKMNLYRPYSKKYVHFNPRSGVRQP